MNYIDKEILGRFISDGEPENWVLQPYYELIIEYVYERLSRAGKKISQKKVEEKLKKLIRKNFISYAYNEYDKLYFYITDKGERKYQELKNII